MSLSLLLGVGAVYVIVAVRYVAEDRPGMALAFLAYAIANLGFAWDLTQ